MPRADNFPQFIVANNVVAAPNNPFGIKGAGEGGTTGAIGVIINAIVDALSELGIREIDLPATPEHIWRLIQDHK
ncbi:MAG: hypothetical protein HQ503_17820 [Rhodospirillales bacterium]|nr:hypothetical protein [Rhodospirillales bacterium]